MKANNVFSVLYRTRVKVQKGDTPILNLSLIFSIIAVCSAPWLAVIGLVVALVLGYHHACGVLLRQFVAGTSRHSHRWFRWFNEAPVLMLVAAVILVVVKPF